MSHFQINPYQFPSGAPPIVGQGTWRELGRTSLGGVSDDVIVSGLDNVEYYMILADIPETTDLQPVVRLGDAGSPDTGANYANRRSDNGAADITSGTNTEIISNPVDVAQKHWFDIGWLSNLFKHEKLMTGRTLRTQTGDATAPFRSEFTGKWVNNEPLDTIALRNLGVGDFQAGTELVVLGYSRFDDGTAPNFWELLGEVTALGGETIITTPVFTPKKYMWISSHSVPDVTAGTYHLRIGNGVVDSGLNYKVRFANNEFGDAVATEDKLTHQSLGTNTRILSNYYCINLDGVEKLLHGRIVGTAPGLVPPILRYHNDVKWDGQANAQINIVQLFRFSGGGALRAGAQVQVWGHD